ncbi:uncharacterized protein TNCV_3030491 [Trichonephila clavipes]|nr:uncharacterized protein TNCV_3030491 [Trichonephila clavipes]
MQVSPVPASDEVCPSVWELLDMRCFGGIPSCEKCRIQVSPVPASDEAWNRINDLPNVCILSENRTTEVSEPVNKCRPLINPVVNKSVGNATSCDFEKKNCDPPVRCTNVSHPSEVGGKEFNVNRSSDCDVKMKVGVCEGRVKTVAIGAQQVIIPDNIGAGSFELKRDKGVTNPEGLICENSCEEKYTLGTLMGCEKQLTVDQESFRNHTMAKIAGQSNRTLPVVWLGKVNRYPKFGRKINAASWVTVLDLWKWYFRRSQMMNFPKHTTCVMTVGMYIIKKSRFKFLCAYDECNLTTRILRLLEPIEVPRMVDIDILLEIWKNRVKKIDFVLKWLSRVESEVGPTKGKLETWGEGVVTSSIVVNPHLSISLMVSPAGQGHVRRHRLSLHFYDPPAVE